MDRILSDERTAIKAGIDAWITAVERRDMSLVAEAVTQDVGSVWIGPGEGEWLAGYDALEQAMRTQNEALSDIRLDVTEETIHTSPQGDMAWATNRWVFNAGMGGGTFAMPLRCTWILEKREDRWVIVHFHKSAAMPR